LIPRRLIVQCLEQVLTADHVHDLRTRSYKPQDYLAASEGLAEVFELLKSGFFSRGDTTIFEPLAVR